MKIIQRKNEGYPVSRDFNSAFSDLIRDFFEDSFLPTRLQNSEWNPKIDVFEKNNTIFVKADIPGMDEKDLDVELNGNQLRISGKKEEEHETKDKNYHRVERSSGSFSRTVSLPDNIIPEKIAADYKKGVLTVTIPETKDSGTKKINVKIA